MKQFLVAFFLILFFTACQNNSRDKANPIAQVDNSSPNNAQQTQKLITKFNPLLEGFWLNKEYIDELKSTKSPQKAYKKVGWMADVLIDTSNIKSDSLSVLYNSMYHEVFNLIIKFQQGNAPNSLKAFDPTDYIESNSYDLKFNKNGTLLTIMRYNKNKKFIDSNVFYKVIGVKGENGVTNKLITNNILIAGKYNLVDSLKNSGKVTFTKEGEVIGLGDYKNYEVIMDYMTPPNNLDEIGFMNGDKRTYYAFKITDDTLKIYETKEVAETDETEITRLKYNLIKLKK